MLPTQSVQLTARVRCRGCGGARQEAEAGPGAPTSQIATLAPLPRQDPAVMVLLVGRTVPYARGG